MQVRSFETQDGSLLIGQEYVVQRFYNHSDPKAPTTKAGDFMQALVASPEGECSLDFRIDRSSRLPGKRLRARQRLLIGTPTADDSDGRLEGLQPYERLRAVGLYGSVTGGFALQAVGRLCLVVVDYREKMDVACRAQEDELRDPAISPALEIALRGLARTHQNPLGRKIVHLTHDPGDPGHFTSQGELYNLQMCAWPRETRGYPGQPHPLHLDEPQPQILPSPPQNTPRPEAG